MNRYPHQHSCGGCGCTVPCRDANCELPSERRCLHCSSAPTGDEEIEEFDFAEDGDELDYWEDDHGIDLDRLED